MSQSLNMKSALKAVFPLLFLQGENGMPIKMLCITSSIDDSKIAKQLVLS